MKGSKGSKLSGSVGKKAFNKMFDYSEKVKSSGEVFSDSDTSTPDSWENENDIKLKGEVKED